MSKTKVIVLFIVVLLLTNISTLLITSFIGINTGRMVAIPSDEYRFLKASSSEGTKMGSVENLILDRYLYGATEQELDVGKLKGMVDVLGDPYSQYFDEEEYKKFNEDTSGTFAGVGIVVTPGDDNYITVVSPIDGTPAFKAGIKAMDKIVKVDGTEYTGKQIDDAVRIMRGEPGTSVVLTIMRNVNDKTEFLEIPLVREMIKVESVKSSVIDSTNLGYIQITSFDVETYDDFKVKLNELLNQNITGLVLDLRGNPGGILDVVKQVADEFLPDTEIIYTETKSGEKMYLDSDSKMIDIPLVVLIDGGSASASEILAGTLKDNNRAELIGVKSFGKGIVQHIHSFDDGTALKLTESEYFLPSGKSINKVGIEPDYIVELPEDTKGIGLDYMETDLQLKKAIEILNNKIAK